MSYSLVENKISKYLHGSTKFFGLSILLLTVTITMGFSQPTVDTPTISAVGTTTATLGGNVTGTLTNRGTRWSATSPVGTSNQLEEASTTAGAFTQARTGLPAASRIFFVAYARDGAMEGAATETTFFTEPVQLTGGQLTTLATSVSAITLTFPAANSWKGTGSTAGYVIYRKVGSAPSIGALADGTVPPADGAGDKIATITDESFTSFNDTGLSTATDYYYTIIPFVWDGAAPASYNYNLATPQTSNTTTLALSLTVTPIAPGTGVVPSSSVLFAGSTTQVLAGFSVTSTGSQTITQFDFNYTPSTSIVNEYLYKNTVAGTLAGATIVNTDGTPDGTFDNAATLTEAITSTPVYYYLVVDVANSVTSGTTPITVNPTQANITVTSGSVNAFSINRTFTFSTSQNSDIVLTGGTTASIGYRSFVATSINDDQSNSISLADFQIRDGGASNDPDNKGMSITSIEIQITNSNNLRRVALFNDNTNTEIAGTEQSPSGSGTVNVIFTPTTPITIGADNGTFDINLRATFKSLVTDKQSIQISIVSATAASTGSGFSPVASWASTQTASNTNVVAVVATKLVFASNPPATPINTNFSLTVSAVDSNPYNNIDLDYTGQIGLTKSPASGTLSAGAQSLTPSLVAGQFAWTTLSISAANDYTLDASDDLYADAIGDATASVIISSSASTVSQPAQLDLCFGGLSQTLGNIVITETDPSGFSSGGSFALTLPTGFVFDQSVTTAPSVGGGSDISAPSSLSYPAANTVQFSYTISGTANTNSITIVGLKIMHPHPGGDNPGTNSGPITRSGGTASIAGVSPGTTLGNVEATLGSPPPVGFGFTVQKINSGDVNVDPNETRFSQNSNSVRLVGTPAATGGATHEFVGSGITFVSGEYRFNPQSLSPGTYDIVFKYKNGAGQKCEFQASKTFEIYTTNITNLAAQYCNNDAETLPMNVTSYLNTFYPEGAVYQGWHLTNFIFWDTPNNVQANLVSPPNNDIFDPKLPAYQPIYSATGNVYGTIGIWIGFIIEGDYDAPPTITYTTICIPLSGCFEFPIANDPPPVAQTRTVWQLIPVRTAPKPSFTLSSTPKCSDDTPVTLVGIPQNSDVIGQDFFTASSDQGSITSSAAPGVVWSFNPQTVVGAPKSINITYTYRDPSTGCSGTSPSKTVNISPRPGTITAGMITKSVGGGSSTQIELCQGSSAGSFGTTTPLTSPNLYKWYEDDQATQVGTGNTFVPPVDYTAAGLNTYYVTQTINECESNKGPIPTTPLSLTVNVIATPPPPATNRDLSYCVGSTIDANDLQITTASGIVKWYRAGNPVSIYTGANPTVANLGINNATAGIYNFELTQTESVNGCEGPLLADRTKIRVEIKPLPNISITPDITDVDKICTTGGIVSFKATDQGNVAPSGSWSGVGLGGSGILNPFNAEGRTELNPLTLLPGVYTLEYEYTDAVTQCENSNSINFTILPTITPSISVGNVCDGSPAVFVNNSQINPISSPTTIAFAEWTLGDGSVIASGPSLSTIPATTNNGRTTGTYFAPSHVYPNVGTFQISGAMITSDGCKYLFPVPPANIPVTVSPLPKINFTWDKVCRDELTGVSSTEFHATELSSPQIAIASYDWDFNLNSLLTHSPSFGGTASEPVVSYNSDGKDSVRLIVTTPFGCQDTVKKPVYIVPKFAPITDNNSYTQDFNVSEDSWLVGGTNPSWEWGVPSKKGSEALGSKGNVWDTRLNGTNNPDEQSWVLSRCFNFSQSLKPVIGLDIFSETPSGVNGAAIQYNYNGNIEDDASWITLGEVGKGINWFDATGISNSPGNQPTGTQVANDMGWTGNENTTNGKYKEWQRAYYRLDELLALAPAQKSNVVFRIAFAAGNSRSDGFAFDDFFIGERSRNVLLENFTNSSSNVSDNNSKYQGIGNSSEIVRVQYHTPFPGIDAINKLNAPMHNARTAFYGITKSPIMRLDGIESNRNTVEDIYDDRVLTPTPLEVTVAATKVGSIVEIVTSIRNKSSQMVPLAGSHIFTTIVQKSITDAALLGASGNTEFAFVAKQMLPSPTGLEIPDNLAASATYTAPKVIWEVNNGDAIVVSVQSIEGNNKEVYQASVSLTPPQPDLVTGIEHIAEFIQLYPNPASNSFVIELPTKTDNRLSVHIVDQVGRVVHESVIETGEQSKTINTQELVGGIYIVQIGAGKSGVVRKKMMIVHKN
jgi:hypothetical protein